MTPCRRRGSRGQTLVEFALVIPILVLVLVGVFDLGRGVFAYNSVTNGAREGARLAIVNQDPALVKAKAKAQTNVAETADPSVVVAYYLPDANGDPDLTAPCGNGTSAAESVSVGCLAVVTFETTFKPITPLIQNIVFPSGVKLTAKTVLAVEFSCPSAAIPVSTNCPKQP